MSDQVLDESLLTTGSASPFLPGTNIQYAYDSTSLGLLKTCPRLYQYTMIDGYVAKGESIHLRFGIEYHQALQDYDIARAEGIDHEDAGQTGEWWVYIDPFGMEREIMEVEELE